MHVYQHSIADVCLFLGGGTRTPAVCLVARRGSRGRGGGDDAGIQAMIVSVRGTAGDAGGLAVRREAVDRWMRTTPEYRMAASSEAVGHKDGNWPQITIAVLSALHWKVCHRCLGLLCGLK